jgi:hypothetical protein
LNADFALEPLLPFDFTIERRPLTTGALLPWKNSNKRTNFLSSRNNSNNNNSSSRRMRGHISSDFQLTASSYVVFLYPGLHGPCQY